MKNNKKNYKRLLFIFTFLSLIVTLQSCNTDDLSLSDQETPNQNLTYLNADISDPANLSQADKEIITEAKDRIDKYVVYNSEKNEYQLNLSSGKEINISDRLYNAFAKTIKQTNLTIKNLNVVADPNDPKKLRVISNETLNIKVRTRIDFFETYEPVANGHNGYDMRWYGCDIYLSNETTKRITLLLAQGAGASAIIALLGGPAAAIPGGVVAAILGYGAAAFGIYNEGKGVVIECSPLGSNMKSR